MRAYLRHHGVASKYDYRSDHSIFECHTRLTLDRCVDLAPWQVELADLHALVFREWCARKGIDIVEAEQSLGAVIGLGAFSRDTKEQP